MFIYIYDYAQENSWAIKRFACAGNSWDLSGKFKVQVSKQIHKNMALRFKNRLSNGRFGKISVVYSGISKEKLKLSLNSWREKARIANDHHKNFRD